MRQKIMHILLVEDEADHADLICRALRSSPERTETTVAHSLAQARASLAVSAPDLLIVDLLLPDGRGTELLPANGEAAPFPIVILTAYGDEQAAVEAMEAGALDYVVKSAETLTDMSHIARRALRVWAYRAGRKRMVAQLLADRERLRSLASELAMAEERERRRIAAGIHDSIAQNLALARMRLESLRKKLAGSADAAELDGLIELTDQSIEQAGALTFELAPPVLFQLGLLAAARRLVEQVAGTHALELAFRHESWREPLNEDLRSLLFRALRELLMNVVRHARAGKARVLLKQTESEVRLCVDDDGIGFDPSRRGFAGSGTGGFGLLSLDERIGYLGGRMDIRSEPGRGTTVTLVIPLDGGRESQDGKGPGHVGQDSGGG
jgi:signal transduction histidine kinase